MSRLLRRLAAAPFRRLPLELRDGAAAIAAVERAVAEELYPHPREVMGLPQERPSSAGTLSATTHRSRDSHEQRER